MLPIEVQIERAQRLVKMLEQDAPLLAVRVAELTPEYQRSAKVHAAMIADCARAELQRLLAQGAKGTHAKRARAARQN